jgi:hypothetical protein
MQALSPPAAGTRGFLSRTTLTRTTKKVEMGEDIAWVVTASG